MWDYSRFDAIDYESSEEDKEATSDEENVLKREIVNANPVDDVPPEMEDPPSVAVNEDFDKALTQMISERMKTEMTEEDQIELEEIEKDYAERMPDELKEFLAGKLIDICGEKSSLTKEDLQTFTTQAYPDKTPNEISTMVEDLCYVNNWGTDIPIEEMFNNYMEGWRDAPELVFAELCNLGFDEETIFEDDMQEDCYQNMLSRWMMILEEHEIFMRFAEERGIDRGAIADFCHPSWFNNSPEGINPMTEHNFVSFLGKFENDIEGLCLFSAINVDFSLSTSSLNSLRVLKLRDCATDDVLRNVSCCCANLIALELIGECISPEALSDLFTSTKQLEFLRFETYGEMSLTPDMMKFLPKLQRLDCHPITDELISAIIDYNPSLSLLTSMDPASTISLSQTVISNLVNARPNIHFEGFDDALLRSIGHPDGFINIDATQLEQEEAIKLLSEHANHVKGVQISDYSLIRHIPESVMKLVIWPKSLIDPNPDCHSRPITLDELHTLHKFKNVELLHLPQALPTYGGLFDGELQLLNTALVSACAAMPNLKEIDLSYSGVTVGAIQSIAMCCKYLKRVVLMNCFGDCGDVNSFMYELQSNIDTNRIQIEANCDHAEVSEFYEEQAKAKLQELGLQLLPEVAETQDEEVVVLDDAELEKLIERKTSKKEVEV